jgi:hypothetical protein
MAQVVGHWPVTVEAQVHNQVSPCRICSGQGGTGAGFSLSSSVFHCQYLLLGSILKYLGNEQ